MPNLLVVDDEVSIQHAFRRVFDQSEVEVVTAGTAAEALAVFDQRRPDVAIVDVNLPDMSGLDLFRRIHDRDARIPVILITGHATTETAIEAIKHGAFDYLFKPLELEELRDLVARAFEISRLMRVAPVVEEGQTDAHDSEALVGRCPAMSEVYKAIGRVAPQDVTVLVQGESGTGKELVARAIYHHSQRSQGPYLAVNCAAIPESLLESELFGHEKGAFTGAEHLRIGKFEQCSGGTLFLDEIADMTPHTQSKMLRVLQDGRLERVGGNDTIETDLRVICATNRDLKQMATEGDFRDDLYYRLSVVTITLPPLRERGDDLPVLANYFLNRFRNEFGKEVREISPEALAILTKYWWPGNVRELESVLKQALLEAQGPVLLTDFLPSYIRVTMAEVGSSADRQYVDLNQFIAGRLHDQSESLHAEVTALSEKCLFTAVLRHTKGNQVQASRILGITRVTLRNKLRLYGITPETFAG